MTDQETYEIYTTLDRMLAGRIGKEKLLAATVTVLVDTGSGVQYESFTIPMRDEARDDN